jgi:predicted nucleotidyltransferase
MIDVPSTQLELIGKILKQHVPGCEVRAFGSRVTQTAKPHSDLDLAIVGAGKISDALLYALKEDFQSSDLTFRVDIVDWHALTDKFKRVIEMKYELVELK